MVSLLVSFRLLYPNFGIFDLLVSVFISYEMKRYEVVWPIKLIM